MADSLSGTAIGQAAMRAADLKRRVVCSRMVVASQKTPASHAGKAEEAHDRARRDFTADS
jgi:hypothetical protein